MSAPSGSTFAKKGNYLEDFEIGARFNHATPRTVSEGDASLQIALTGARQPLFSSAPFARSLGYRTRPIDDLLVFNIAFGKTVNDISLNAVANLGYADVRFLAPVYAGDTLTAETEIIGLRETSDGKNGIVYVRSSAFNQDREEILTWARWVLVRKRDAASPPRPSHVPPLPDQVAVENLPLPPVSPDTSSMARASGSTRFWDDFAPGDRIDHPSGMTLDESDHTLATRLFQNNAKVHFDALEMAGTPHGRRLVYGGHVIAVCRALSHDGIENALSILAINGGAHRAPTFAGDTLYCFTEVVEKIALPLAGAGALRLRLVGLSNQPPAGFRDRITIDGKERFDPAVVLDLDYTVLMPRHAAAA
ncbi:MAG: MaoC family dehydratase [Sphingomonadales bacterium]